eukprot:5493396-Alexandrium_andersonii.AAC.1
MATLRAHGLDRSDGEEDSPEGGRRSRSAEPTRRRFRIRRQWPGQPGPIREGEGSAVPGGAAEGE